MHCPSCAETVPEDDLFCENCGGKLGTPEPSASVAVCACGAAANEVDEEGFCLRCGKRLQRPASDHVEASLSAAFAAVSDRGLRHDRNEDRFAIAQGNGGIVMVVCDGVSASRTSELASAALSQTIADTLGRALEAGAIEDPETAMREAIHAGAAAVARAAPAAAQAHDNPPSSTVVAALVRDGNATLGWVGDSRAYWITADEALPLTKDHSWMNAVVEAGDMTPEQAAAAPQAHAITRWIGADSGDASIPDTREFELSSPGTLLLCSDGLWNYAASPEAMHALLQQAHQPTRSDTAEAGPDALAIASYLVQFANDSGGQDNVTVALFSPQQSK